MIIRKATKGDIAGLTKLLFEVQKVHSDGKNEKAVAYKFTRGGKAAQIFEIEIEHFSGKEVHER